MAEQKFPWSSTRRWVTDTDHEEERMYSRGVMQVSGRRDGDDRDSFSVLDRADRALQYLSELSAEAESESSRGESTFNGREPYEESAISNTEDGSGGEAGHRRETVGVADSRLRTPTWKVGGEKMGEGRDFRSGRYDNLGDDEGRSEKVSSFQYKGLEARERGFPAIYTAVATTPMLHLRVRLPNGVSVYIDVDPRTDTVFELKAKILKREPWLRRQGIDIVHRGVAMQDDWLVVDCGIDADGTVHVQERGLESTLRRADPSLTRSERRWVSPTRERYQQSVTENGDHKSTHFHEADRRPDLNVDLDLACDWEGHVRPEEGLFLEALKSYEEDSAMNTEQLAEVYQNMCNQRITELRSGPRGKSESSVSAASYFREERDTWNLLAVLQPFLEDDSEESASGISGGFSGENEPTEEEVLNHLYVRDRVLQQLDTVRRWLESTAMERIEYQDKQRRMWARTLKQLQTGSGPNELVHTVDPDAPEREQSNIQVDDEEDQLDLLRAVWAYLRAGLTDQAAEHCIRAGEPWRTATLLGGRVTGAGMRNQSDSGTQEDDKENSTSRANVGHNDFRRTGSASSLMQSHAPGAKSSSSQQNQLLRWGNPCRELWLKMCWQLADKREEMQHRFSGKKRGVSRLADYECAIYASQCSHVKHLLASPVCQSWEDHLWVMVKAAIERREDEALYRHKQELLQRTRLRASMESDRLMKEHLEKTADLAGIGYDRIFQVLQHAGSERVREDGRSPFHLIQATIIQGRIDTLVAELLHPLVCGGDAVFGDQCWDLRLADTSLHVEQHRPELLRLATHLTLFLRRREDHDETAERAGQQVIKAYIRHLAKHKQISLAAYYGNYLPPAGRRQVHAQVLRLVARKEERAKALEQATELFPEDATVMTLLVVSLLRREGTIESSVIDRKSKADSMVYDAEQSTSRDSVKIRALEWLCFVPHHRAALLLQSNWLCREFVARDRLDLLRQVLQVQVPPDSVDIVETTPQSIAEAARNIHLNPAAQSEEDFERRVAESAVREHRCWQVYLAASEAYAFWRQKRAQLGESGLTGRRAVAEGEQYLDMAVQEAVVAILAVLHFPGGWLDGLANISDINDSDAGDSSWRDKFCRLCLPPLLFNLHNVLYESGRWLLSVGRQQTALPYFQQSLELADVVADSEFGICNFMTVAQIRQLLRLSSQSAIAVIQLDSREGR